jgi:hypothetical protein
VRWKHYHCPYNIASMPSNWNMLLHTGKGFSRCGHSSLGSTPMEVPGRACVGPGRCWPSRHWDHVRLPLRIAGE